MSAVSVLESFFESQGYALFEFLDERGFRRMGSWPPWCRALWGEVSPQNEDLRLGEASPFLENFLVDAEQFWDSQSAGSVRSGNWIERDPGGREIPLEASAYLLGGKRILIVRNLSETFAQQQELLQTARDSLLVYERLLREIQKKEILLHCIVHDLTQPLSAMNSVFHLLERGHLPAPLKKYVKAGERESQRQELMIRGILEAFSSDLAAQSRDQEHAGQPDLTDCARRAVHEFATPFRDHDVRLRLDPRTNKSKVWRVTGDAPRIDRIFGNLLENAMRYSPKGTTVSVGVEDQGSFVLAFVDDEGPGLPKDQPEMQLFALFSKGKTHSGKAGLGLYFCKITVERWGGSIGAESRARGGSRFWFRLPRAQGIAPNSESAEAEKSQRHEKRGAKANPAKRLRILVADDTDINRELVVELLEARGHIAIGACDGRAAVAELGKHDFDVLLIDEEMPHMTGLEATRAIREQEAGTARHQIIVGISGHATEQDEQRFREAGMDALLAKPVHMRELYQVVESTAAELAKTSAEHSSEGGADAPAGRLAPSARPATREDVVAHLRQSTGANQKLMSSLAGILLADAPKTLSLMGRAIARNDSVALGRSAHLLKGSLAIFGASSAVECARSLEAMGRAAKLDEAPLALRTLETEFAILRAALLPLVRRPKSSAGSLATRKKAKPSPQRRKR